MFMVNRLDKKGKAMNFKKHAIILSVIEFLHRHGSWTGKIQIQKALSLLHDKDSAKVPFQFVIYRHGPYSFEVEEELEQMRSYGAIEIEPNAQGYGVVLRPGPMADIAELKGKIAEETKQAISAVCRFVGNRDASDLERLATASWIRKQEKKDNNQAVALRLHQLKPHISIMVAEEADRAVGEWLNQATPL